MSLSAAAIRLLAAKGLSIADIADIAEANEDLPTGAPTKAAERTRRWRERRQASQTVTGDVTRDAAPTVTGDVTERHKPSPGDAPRARGRDIKLTSENNLKLSLERVRECAGDALASMATHPGIASMHELTALLRGDNPCDLDDVYAAVTKAAAWHKARAGPGSMTSWTTARRMAVELRDKRLAGAPDPIPLRPDQSHDPAQRPSPKFAAKRDNLARAFAGPESAARARTGS